VRIIRTSGKEAPVSVEPSAEYDIPSVAIKSDEAEEPVREIIEELADYRGDDGVNTRSEGARTIVKRLIGAATEGEVEWETFEHTNGVRARWLFDREVRRRHKGALGVAATSDPKLLAVGIELAEFETNGPLAHDQAIRDRSSTPAASVEVRDLCPLFLGQLHRWPPAWLPARSRRLAPGPAAEVPLPRSALEQSTLG
jgi:hypothetical protein